MSEHNPLKNLSRERIILLALCSLCIVLVAIVLTASGIILAQESATDNNAWLVGVFITTAQLDIPSETPQGPIRANWRGHVNTDALFRPGRLYAQWCEIDEKFEFPDIEGIPFFVALSPPSERSPDGFYGLYNAPGIESHGMHVHHGDNSLHIDIEGTIHAVPGSQAQATVYKNRVFQTQSGDVFLEAALGGSSVHGISNEGDMLRQTFTASTTITERGVETSHSISVAVGVSAMFPPETIVILQMDENNQLVNRTMLAPSQQYETLYLAPITEYVIIETHRAIPPGTHGQAILREIISAGELGIATFYARDDGILEGSWIPLSWPE